MQGVIVPNFSLIEEKTKKWLRGWQLRKKVSFREEFSVPSFWRRRKSKDAFCCWCQIAMENAHLPLAIGNRLQVFIVSVQEPV